MSQKSSSSSVFLEWLPEFDLGVPEIDRQHRGLRDLVNGLAEALTAASSTAAEEAMEQLLRGSHAHFDFEEELMRREGYAGIELHHEQHSELLASMQRLHDELRGGRQSIDRARTLKFLRDWFVIHIVRTDGDLAAFLKTREGAGQPA